MSSETEVPLDFYMEKRKGIVTLAEYVMVVRRHPLIKIPSWMGSYDALGIDLDGRLVFDCYRYENIKPQDRTDKMFVVSYDPLNPNNDIRLYWNPDTQVWIGLQRGFVRLANSWPHAKWRRHQEVMSAAKSRYRTNKGQAGVARSRLSETLAMRKAAREAEAAAASGILS